MSSANIDIVNTFIDSSDKHLIANVGWEIAYEEAKRRAISMLEDKIDAIRKLSYTDHKKEFDITD